MSSSLSLPLNAAPHPDDAVSGLKVSLARPTSSANDLVNNIQKLEALADPSVKTNNVALSFAYDIATKSLHVVLTDKASGEVVRKMSYTHFPVGTHQTEQLHGLLLDQMA
jgi:uncharacterized FlaG/YvyC family protein